MHCALLTPGCDSAEEALRAVKEPAMEYRMDPNRQPRFIIRSCFGGSNAAFVASGSEVGTLLLIQHAEDCILCFFHGHHAK